MSQTIRLGPDDDLQAAIAPGVTLRLRPGRYQQSLMIDVPDVAIEGPKNDAPFSSPHVAQFWRSHIEVTAGHRLRLEHLVFLQSVNSSLSTEVSDDLVIRHCRFMGCGVPKGTVTVYLGLASHRATIEHCHFDTLNMVAERHGRHRPDHDIAIMASATGSTHHVIRHNVIERYTYSIHLGRDPNESVDGHHQVMDNQIIGSVDDAINVLHGRCTIEGNVIHACRGPGIHLRGGTGSVVRLNTVTDSRTGCLVRGTGHQITDNTFERCRQAGIVLAAKHPLFPIPPAHDVVVRQNRLVDCGGADAEPYTLEPCAGIVLGTDQPQDVSDNVIQGDGEPWACADADTRAGREARGVPEPVDGDA